MDDCVISSVVRQGGRQGRLGPVLVRFEHGQVVPDAFQQMPLEFSYKFPDSIKSEDEAAALKPTLPKCDLKMTAKNLTYSSNTKSVKGRTISSGNPYQKTFLAIRNKSTRRVKMVEACCVSLGATVDPPASTNTLLLKEEIKASMQSEEATEQAQRLEERKALNKHLVGEFGQTKGRRAYEQADRMKVESTALSDKLNRAAMAVDAKTVALPSDLAAAGSSDLLIPPCNREAGLVNDVYKLEDLVTSTELSALSEAAQELLENYTTVDDVKSGVEGRTFSPLFGSHLEKCVGISSDNKSSMQRLATAIYMESIVQFVNLRPQAFSQGPRGLRQTHFPHIVKDKVFRDFTSLQGTVSPETRDKAMCYVIVLALLVSSFQADFAALAASLRVKAEQMKRLARLVGATVQTDGLTNKSFVILKLPLASFDIQGSFKKRGGNRK